MKAAVARDVERLVGAVIERVETPAPRVVVLRLRLQDEHGERSRAFLVLAVTPSARGIGLCASRPRGLPASAFGMLLRKHLEGARVEQVARGARTLRLALASSQTKLALSIDLARGDVVLGAPDGAVLGSLRRGEPPGSLRAPTEGTSEPGPLLAEEGTRLLAALELELREVRRAALASALRRAIERATRRCQAIAADLERAEGAAALRHRATLLSPIAASLPSGASSAVVQDWSQSPPAALTVPLDPARPARIQVEAMFRRARGLERGRAIAEQRASVARAELAELRRLHAGATAGALSDAALDDLFEQARRARVPALPAETHGEPPRKQPARAPYRTFDLSHGHVAYVGKSAADNDTLTLQVARPFDLWMHARGRPGSHVVVPLERGKTCPADVLVEAAHLAAHFGAARDADRVEIAWTERRHVRKPRGSPAGSVRVDRERVLLLRVEPARLRALLGNERR